jgi:hypothetical protein
MSGGVKCGSQGGERAVRKGRVGDEKSKVEMDLCPNWDESFQNVFQFYHSEHHDLTTSDLIYRQAQIASVFTVLVAFNPHRLEIRKDRAPRLGNCHNYDRTRVTVQGILCFYSDICSSVALQY